LELYQIKNKILVISFSILVMGIIVPVILFSNGSNQALATLDQQAAPGQTNRVFLHDTFDTDLAGWQHFGYPGYVVSLDATNGQPSPSANISGDTYLGICSNHGMAKVVDISNYHGEPLTLAFDWRASSSPANVGLTTQAEVSVDNADTGQQLFVHRLVRSDIGDTGWQHYSTNISKSVSGVSHVRIDLYLYDCWVVDYNEKNWYDNISLFKGKTLP
jgi:hypothetical protein